MGVSNWLPELKAATEQRERERIRERETEESATAFLGIAENHLAQPPAPEMSDTDKRQAIEKASSEGLSSRKAEAFILASRNGLEEGAKHIVEGGDSRRIDEAAEDLVRQVQSLELSKDKLLVVLNALAPMIVWPVSQRLQETQHLPPATVEAVLHVAIQSLRAALTKPEFIKAQERERTPA